MILVISCFSKTLEHLITKPQNIGIEITDHTKSVLTFVPLVLLEKYCYSQLCVR